MKIKQLMFAAAMLLILSFTGHAQVKITVDHNEGAAATSQFKFKRVPSPIIDDARPLQSSCSLRESSTKTAWVSRL